MYADHFNNSAGIKNSPNLFSERNLPYRSLTLCFLYPVISRRRIFASRRCRSAAISITRSYGNEDVRHTTSMAEPLFDGRHFSAFMRTLVTLVNLTETYCHCLTPG